MKIMIVSDSPKRVTGFGRQTRDLHLMFKNLGHETVFIGMHSEIEGQGFDEYDGSKIYAMAGPGLQFCGQCRNPVPQPDGMWNAQDKHWIQQACLEEKPDMVLIVWDLRKVLGIVRDFDRFFRCPVYLYWLFDSSPISHNYIELMQNTRVKVLPVSKCISSWLDDAKIPYVFESIPEPIHLSKFYRVDDETRARFKKDRLGDQADKVCFGFVGGNFHRKNIPFIIDAFAALPKDIRDDSVLFLHTDPGGWERNPQSYNLTKIIESYHSDIKDQIIFSQSNNDLGFNMCEIYNVMDYFVSGAYGEGWGLPAAESMACGVPVIMGDISTSEEIIGDTGFRVPIGGSMYTSNPFLRITVPSFQHFVAAMNEAYMIFREESTIRHNATTRMIDDIEYDSLSQAARERAETFSLENVQVKWDEFFNDAPYGVGWKSELINESILLNTQIEESPK